MKEMPNVLVSVAGPGDSERICEIMLATGVGEGTGISEATFKKTMTVENVRESFDKMLWLLWDGGLFLFIEISNSTYEVHVAVLEEHRGAKAIAAAQKAMSMVFIRTPCVLLVGRTPLKNRPACMFAAMTGLRKVRESGGSQIASICFFDWLATRNDPVFALSQCEEWGQSVKSAASRITLDWITRGEIANKQRQEA